jgi:hypothetical protein
MWKDAREAVAGDTYAIHAFHRRLREQLRPFAFVDLGTCQQHKARSTSCQRLMKSVSNYDRKVKVHYASVNAMRALCIIRC